MTAHAALRRISGWIAIACRPVVDRLAGLTWQGISDSGEEIEKSPFIDLLRRPNPQQSGGLVLRMVAQTLVLCGEAYSDHPSRSALAAPGRAVAGEPFARRARLADGQLFYDIIARTLPAGARAPLARRRRAHLPPASRRSARALRRGCDGLQEVLAEEGWSQSVRHWFEQDARPTMLLEFGSEDAGTHTGSVGALLTPVVGGAAPARRPEVRRADAGGPGRQGARGRRRRRLGESRADRNGAAQQDHVRARIPALVGSAGEANRASAEAALWSFDFSAVHWAQLIVDAVNY